MSSGNQIAPSYRGLKPSSGAASAAMRGNTAKETRPEKLLREELWKRGLRYRKNVKHLPGKPDIVFRRPRLAIFCDGDFWHGRNWQERKSRLKCGSNAEYWVGKIERNIARDRDQRALLQEAGWQVLSFWEGEILADVEMVADCVAAAYNSTVNR